MTTAPLPMLRPLSIGELLDHALRLYRRNFLKFVGIIAVVQIPMTLLTMLASVVTVSSTFYRVENYNAPTVPQSSWELLGPVIGMGALITLGLGLLSFVLLQGLATAALTRAIAGDYLGEQLSFIEAYRKVGKTWPKVISAQLWSILITILLMIWSVVPCIGWLSGTGMLIFFSMAIMAMVPAIVVLEKQAPLHAIRRGWELTRRRFWGVVGVVALLLVLNQILITGPATLIQFAMRYVVNELLPRSSSLLTLIPSITQGLVNMVMGLLYWPLQLTAITLLYFDLRVRTEGFDLAWLAEHTLAPDTTIEDIVAPTPTAEQPKSLQINNQDLSNFILLSIAGAVIIGIFSLFFVMLGFLGVFGLSGI